MSPLHYTTTSPNKPPLPEQLRQLMRSVPHPVVIATATAPASSMTSAIETPLHRYKGMTLSSFTTLTLTPDPIVTFNIRRPSQTLDAIASSRMFLVHMLAATNQGALLADTFTRGNTDVDFSKLQWHGRGDLEEPLLQMDGVTRVLRCELLETHSAGLVDVGDHTIVLGRVMEISTPSSDKRNEHNMMDRHLCYLNGTYRRVREIIAVPKKESNNDID